IAVRGPVTEAALVQTRGTGASGSSKKKPAAKKTVATTKSPNKAKKTPDWKAARALKKTTASPKKAAKKIAVRGLVTEAALVQTGGTGASGSSKMSKKAAEPAAKTDAPQKNKPAAKKTVATTKSPSTAKTPDRKAARALKKTTASPKKAAKKVQAGRQRPGNSDHCHVSSPPVPPAKALFRAITSCEDVEAVLTSRGQQVAVESHCWETGS
ncbi:unnamed protein product, partial [Tetraodon nigroviridis]